MKVSDAMTSDVRVVRPEQSICQAAQIMAECDSGALPVTDGERLIGVVTDRDIAIRAVAREMSPDTTVGEIMSTEVLYCYEDESLEDVAQNMGDMQVRRMPVMSRAKRLVGIVSIGDLSLTTSPDVTGLAVADVSRPGGRHSQTHPAG
jgi:CBS domain-containing protein